ncbi:MAG: RNA polymerase sigma factor [Deltaproteobacteria bacterium]|nr:RNA polymerase sigma factor [Deltaproteobacteria bacterium]
MLRSIAMNLCKDPPEAHDVVQDTLERAFRTFKRLSGEVSPRPWLATILRNRVIDGWRSGRLRQTETLEGVDARAEEPEEKPRWAAITDTQLRAAIDQLPEEFRVAYRMHALEGRTYKEIAAVLGVPSATVGTRILRARRRLRDLLEPHLGEDE